jgi:asparagine synthase (glutamine-hydrolysing)
MPATKVQKLADVLRAGDENELRRKLVRQWDDPAALLIDGDGSSVDEPVIGSAMLPTIADRMMLEDCLTELPDDMLVKVDRASMSCSLETRLPLLDPAIVAFAWRLPGSMRIRGTQGKWLLRRVLDRYVPRRLFERPKMGFDPPVASWLRGPLRPWAEDLLQERRLREDGLNPNMIRRRWDEHQRGRRNWDYPLWTVLALQSWRDHQRVGSA